MKWEYWQAEWPSRERDRLSLLDSFGKEGWELCLIYNDTAYFKRPLRTKLEAEILAHFDYPQRDRRSEV